MVLLFNPSLAMMTRGPSLDKIVLDCHLQQSSGLSTWHSDSYIFQGVLGVSLVKVDIQKTMKLS